VGFWSLTSEQLAHEQTALATSPRSLRATPGAVRSPSQREHLRLQQGLLDGSLEYELLVLRREE
jgi:hypothetical protein